MKFENKNVLITGGTTGIGFATASAFIDQGANVWITGRTEKNLQKAADAINSKRLKTVVADTANLAAINNLQTVFDDGRIKLDVLYLNAGIAKFDELAKATEADFDAQFNTNVKGVYFTLQKFIPLLNEGASVLFTSSTVATSANLGSSIYAATKGALTKIAQVAANELAPRKIRVNIVSPGPIQTEGLEKAVPSKEDQAYLQSATALNRFGKPSEIAGAVLYLASEEAAFISGTELMVDGGYRTFAMK